MSDAHTEILSAFCDGEAVDPDALAIALADPRAREALIDFVRLRSAVAVDVPLPASLGQLRTSVPAPRPRRLGWVALPAAAAMALLMLVGAWLVPRGWIERTADQPPSPSRVVQFQPGVDWRPLEPGR